jgi:hypothetical protein
MPPKYEKKAKERIRACVRRYVDIVARAESEGFNESDTANIVQDILCEGLGYEKFFEITSEFQIKRHYADFAIKLNGKVRYFVEVKAIGSRLSDRDLFQVQSYSASHNLSWMLLTNGRIWRCYHLSAGSPPTVSMVFEADLLQAREDLDGVVQHLYLLSKEAIPRGSLPDYWEFARATSPEMIASCLLSDTVLRSIRREIRRKTSQNIKAAQVSEVLMTQVIKGNVVDLVSKQIPKKRKRALKGKPVTLEEHLDFRGASSETRELYRLLEEGIKSVDPSISRKIAKWSVTFYSPAKVFAYVKAQKSSIRIHCFTGSTPIEGVENPWKESPKWGRCYLKGKEDLDQILAILRESHSRVCRAIENGENTGRYAKID